MDLLCIDPNTWYSVGGPIQHYSSLIWSEKYLDDGEFELKTVAVDYTREKMPLESVVAIRESGEVMVVEEHTIDVDDKGFETLTVRGKSITSFTKHRVVGPARTERYKLAGKKTNLDAGLVLLYTFLVYSGTYDITRAVNSLWKDPLDAIPNMVLTDSTAEETTGNPGAQKQRWIEPGLMDTVLRKFYNRKPYGLRMVRPPRPNVPLATEGSYMNITFNTTGAINRDSNFTSDKLSFDVYLGLDRSHAQSAVQPVIFDTEIDDLIMPNYVLSIAYFKSAAHIVIDRPSGIDVLWAYSSQDHPTTGAAANTLGGIQRRVTFRDAGQPEENFVQTEWDEHNIDLAEEELVSLQRLYLIDGAISPYTKIKYGQDYRLGDVVSVRGRYIPLRRARVTEYIRTEDEQGERAYPSLTYL